MYRLVSADTSVNADQRHGWSWAKESDKWRVAQGI